MLKTFGKLGLAALAMTALGLVAMPSGAQPPEDAGNTGGGPELSNRPIRLNLENTDLYTAIKLLFSQAKAQYTLDPNLRGIYITAQINQPFRIALETLLRASNQPLTYSVENGVYSIVPKKEDVVETPTTDQATADQRSDGLSPAEEFAAVPLPSTPMTSSCTWAGVSFRLSPIPVTSAAAAWAAASVASVAAVAAASAAVVASAAAVAASAAVVASAAAAVAASAVVVASAAAVAVAAFSPHLPLCYAFSLALNLLGTGINPLPVHSCNWLAGAALIPRCSRRG